MSSSIVVSSAPCPIGKDALQLQAAAADASTSAYVIIFYNGLCSRSDAKRHAFALKACIGTRQCVMFGGARENVK